MNAEDIIMFKMGSENVNKHVLVFAAIIAVYIYVSMTSTIHVN
jgi:hypothetical protein